MVPKLLILLVLSVTLQNVNSARILAVIPTPSYSHQMFYQQIWRQLALRGHDMVIITTDPTGEQLPNFKEVSIHESYIPFKRMLAVVMKLSIIEMYLNPEVAEMAQNLTKLQLELPQVQEIMRNETEHFDLLMIEHMPSAFFALKKRFNCPMIGMMSLDAFPQSHETMGNPVNSVLYPSFMLPYSEDMTFWQRLVAVGFGVFSWAVVGYDMDKMNANAKEYFGFDVDVFDLMEKTDMLFINANPLITPVRPLSPSTINIAGGVHMKPHKELPKDLNDFLDTSPQGVIYFSFGSNVKSNELIPELREIIIKTLSQLPYKVLWKFEDDTLPGKPDNVKIIKWAPQQDILQHPNVKVFITQGGIQSLEESLYYNVPMVVVGFLWDQIANARKVQAKGLGLSLDPKTLNINDFKSAILEVMENPKYRDNIRILAAQIQDQPMTPMNKAIWWTEYVLRHKGAQHLKGPRIPLYQFFYLDVWMFLGAILLVLLGIFIGVVKLSCKGIQMLRGKKPKMAQKVKVKKS